MPTRFRPRERQCFVSRPGPSVHNDWTEYSSGGIPTDPRDHITGIIARGSFHPVFQPIVDFTRNKIVGYEALTRFDDGEAPEALFAKAAVVGLGLELETATLRAALAAAEALPVSRWLNLNASPDLIVAGEPLRTLPAGNRRDLVLEVTEHTVIADYPAFRLSMAALGPKVRFAVDDAGVGFSSLRHVLELHPAFVKLDRSLVAGLESDQARQAMIVGLRDFSRATGCRLIAEGVETEAELAELGRLQVGLAQGFLLGMPLPIDEAVRSRQDRTRSAKRPKP
jgi:EAL domain-containing protein (putative c-di-GMP-specific phosphodiesterase class I)